MRDDISLATVIGPHGLKGEVRLKLFTDSVDKLSAYGPLRTPDGQALRIQSARDSKAGEAIAAFAEIADRDAADSLRGKDLMISRDALPETDSNEYYHTDLVGLRVDDSESRTIGRVRAIHNFGAGDVVEIKRPDGDSLLLAFTRENVPFIDLIAGPPAVLVPVTLTPGHRTK